MRKARNNNNFIDKTFTIIADVILRVFPASQQEKKAFSYYLNGLSAQDEGEYAEALNNYYQALQIEEEYANRILLVNEQKNDSIFKSTEQSYSNRILLANGNLDKEKVIYEEEIYFLNKMFDAKFISQEEYEKKRKKILANL